MSSHPYLVKADDRLVSHCKCPEAPITFPPQMDCPWCGCGWLFTCITCRKAFTFARVIETDEPWEDLARRDITNRGSPAEPERIRGWCAAMKQLLANVVPGKTYVTLDGLFLPTDATRVAFDGWYARHDLAAVPHVTALQDRGVLDRVLANRDYWLARRFADDDR